MNETEARLVDAVLPQVPIRQWVLTVPHALRYAMARDPKLTSDSAFRFGTGLFFPVSAPDDEDVAEVVMRVYRTVLKLFDSENDEFGASGARTDSHCSGLVKQDGGDWRAEGIPCTSLEHWRKGNVSLHGQSLRWGARV